ncbi:uncharacterized protein LOC144603180 [Rhinoraja longicauda]
MCKSCQCMRGGPKRRLITSKDQALIFNFEPITERKAKVPDKNRRRRVLYPDYQVRKLFPAQTDLAKRLLLIFLSVVILQVYFATEEEPGLSSTEMDSPSDLPWYGTALIPTASDRAETHCILHLVAGSLWKPPNSQRCPTRDSSSQVHKL